VALILIRVYCKRRHETAIGWTGVYLAASPGLANESAYASYLTDRVKMLGDLHAHEQAAAQK